MRLPSAISIIPKISRFPTSNFRMASAKKDSKAPTQLRPTYFLALPLHAPYISPPLNPLPPHPSVPTAAISPPEIHHLTLQLFTTPTPERILNVLNSSKLDELMSYSMQLRVEGLDYFGGKTADDARVLWAHVGLQDGGESALEEWCKRVKAVFAEEIGTELYPPVENSKEVEVAGDSIPEDAAHTEETQNKKKKEETFTPHLTLANTTFLSGPQRKAHGKSKPHFKAAELIAEHAATVWGTPTPTAVTLCRMGTRRGGEWGPGYEVVGARQFGDVDVPGGRVKVETVISVTEDVEGEELGVGKDGRRGSVVWSVVKRGSVVEVEVDGIEEGADDLERVVEAVEKVELAEAK